MLILSFLRKWFILHLLSSSYTRVWEDNIYKDCNRGRLEAHSFLGLGSAHCATPSFLLTAEHIESKENGCILHGRSNALFLPLILSSNWSRVSDASKINCSGNVQWIVLNLTIFTGSLLIIFWINPMLKKMKSMIERHERSK